MPFISNTDKNRKEMLESIGVQNFEELISFVPQKHLVKGLLDLEEPKSEMEISRHLNNLAKQNVAAMAVDSYLGAGVYEHFVPAAVENLAGRAEFLTAYTPYQAEVSQGTLQAIYEFQSLICELTGMEIANAGMYDGATATAEAILMAARKSKKFRAVVAGTIHPDYLKVINAYTEGIGLEIVVVPAKNGIINSEDLDAALTDDTACAVIQTPNFLGNLEDCFELEKIIHKYKKALFIAIADPFSLAALNSPAEYNADIVVGEAQGMGNAMNFGGPLLGYFACRKSLARKMPGRIVGATVDADGNKGYVLTLQAREQHIYRQKATSNICSNQALAALCTTIYLSLMGKQGFKEAAYQGATKAHYLANELVKNGFMLAFEHPYFNEFAVKVKNSAKALDKLAAQGVFGGLDLTPYGYENIVLIAVTETKSKEQLDYFAKALKEADNA